jgi:hypothetical protein
LDAGTLLIGPSNNALVLQELLSQLHHFLSTWNFNFGELDHQTLSPVSNKQIKKTNTKQHENEKKKEREREEGKRRRISI